jgi:hypothetical protein
MSSSLLLFVSVVLSSLYSVFSTCGSSLRLHPLYQGIGVFAERFYHEGEVIAWEPSLSIHRNFSDRTMIDYYASSIYDQPDHDNLIFGNGFVYNHHPDPNVAYLRAEFPLNGPSDLIRYVFIATKDIEKGKQMFISYGTDLWFTHRNLEMVLSSHDTPQADLDLMKKLPGCIRSSLVFSQGNVYTTERIKRGEVIEVNRAIVIPGHIAIGNDLEEYVWFREGYNKVTGALLILGRGALFNTSQSVTHAEADEGDGSNVIYSWYNPAIDSLDPMDHRDNVTCAFSMLVMFIATKDIEVGEILTVPLTRDSTPFTIRAEGDELTRPKPRKYRSSVRRKLIFDRHLPGGCF